MAAIPFDYSGAALLVGSIGGLLTVVSTMVLSILTFVRQGRIVEEQRIMRKEGQERDLKLTEVHGLVNGVSTALNAANKKIDHAEGKAEGVAEERANPQVPSHPLPVEVVNEPTNPVHTKPG